MQLFLDGGVVSCKNIPGSADPETGTRTHTLQLILDSYAKIN